MPYSDTAIRDSAEATTDPRPGADLHRSLSSIRARAGKTLVDLLLDVQDCFILNDVKSLDWVSRLQCLSISDPASRKRRRANDVDPVPDKTLTRIVVNGRTGSYLAVSYPWEASSSPDSRDSPQSGGWRVKTLQERTHSPSPVRDVVLERTSRLAKQLGCDSVWIDRECIPQDDSPENEVAMHTMDLVYHFSNYAVALLFHPIRSAEDLKLFSRLLLGRLVESDGGEDDLRENVDPETAQNALRILQQITADPWWERAWTFQENYCAREKMVLLIPIDRSHWKRKQKFEFWRITDVPGELGVKSVEFSKAATRFCLAYLRSSFISEEDEEKCQTVLRKAARYRFLLRGGHTGAIDYSRTMTLNIFEDIAHRKARFPFDFLPISSNCCEYSVRLDSSRLNAASASLSVAILALYFLNGEIFKNRPQAITPVPLDNLVSSITATYSQAIATQHTGWTQHAGYHTQPPDFYTQRTDFFTQPLSSLPSSPAPSRPSLTSLDALTYLKSTSLDNFIPPVTSAELSFLKSCRFPSTRLTRQGIRTRGILWRLDRKLSTRDSRFQGACARYDEDTDETYWRPGQAPLELLAEELRTEGFGKLAELLIGRGCFRVEDPLASGVRLGNDGTGKGEEEVVEEEEGEEEEEEEGEERVKKEEDDNVDDEMAVRHTGSDSDSPSERYMRIMAKNLSRRVATGHSLYLGRLWDPSRHHRRRRRSNPRSPSAFSRDGSAAEREEEDEEDEEDEEGLPPHTAIFIEEWEPPRDSFDETQMNTQLSFYHRHLPGSSTAGAHGHRDATPELPTYAFTAWSGYTGDVDRSLEQSQIDKYVSLEVEMDDDAGGEEEEGKKEEEAEGRVEENVEGRTRPLLRTRRWLNGLCFFDRGEEVDVTFAWPPGLEDMPGETEEEEEEG